MLSFAHTACLYLIKNIVKHFNFILKIEIFLQFKIALLYLDVYIKMQFIIIIKQSH